MPQNTKIFVRKAIICSNMNCSITLENGDKWQGLLQIRPTKCAHFNVLML